MNRSKLKIYAPQARRDFIKAVTDRAAYYGLMKDKIEPIAEQGDVAIITGKPFPRAVAAKRKRLEEQIRRQGFEQVMEAMAYTWFNRLVAIRFMELHGYLDHGYRVLSHPEGTSTLEIIEHAEHVDLPGLDREKVIELKLEGTKEAELYHMLLIAQCNALHKAMPFLFEQVDDETELLLPENLLHSDSVMRKLVNEIPEKEWQDVEIIGWLYQFYISDKKAQVIGKVVKSEDIPAATQLFTPNWIVKYMVQNTLGRQWVATYPNSPLKAQMEYYIEPAEQTPEVQEQFKAITPESLNPEELTLLDPACGSGHILVEAYELLKAIYQERGYRTKDIPRLILQKNLYGLEIDDRAAQLAAFALMMKARADDRRIFGNGTHPNVLAIQESKGLKAKEITEAINAPILKAKLPPPEFLFEEMEEERAPLFSRKRLSMKGEMSRADVAQLIDLFEHGKTFGSLIRVPKKLAEKLHEIAERVEDVLAYGEMFGQAAGRVMKPLVEQARILAGKYDAVVTNPPYMGVNYFTPTLKEFVGSEYRKGKGDLYGCFIEAACSLTREKGYFALITIPNWMFLGIFESLRARLLHDAHIVNLVHNGRGVFGSDFGTVSFVVRKTPLPRFNARYRRLFTQYSLVASNSELKKRFFATKNYSVDIASFAKLPGQPIAYWISSGVRTAFEKGVPVSKITAPKQGVKTGNNALFLREWWEVTFDRIGFGYDSYDEARDSRKKWFPCTKGGEFRKWYGNNEFVLNWENDGYEIRNYTGGKGRIKSRPQNTQFFFKEGITWSKISISHLSMRLFPRGFCFESIGSVCFSHDRKTDILLLGLFNSKVARIFLEAIAPTVDFGEGSIGKIPVASHLINFKELPVSSAIELAREDWDCGETSWDFSSLPIVQFDGIKHTETSYRKLEVECERRIARMQELEEKNNRIFIEAYALQDILSPEVSEGQITLYRPDREEDIRRLISYVIGCSMGRYSLDKPGLIYAHSENKGFDPGQYRTFPPDQDGIIPINDTDWFEDDAANRVGEFIAIAWPKENLEDNLEFVAESLGTKRGESHREAIRRYLTAGFYKHHLSMYKKRPIYWLFCSGKQRAFQCLVYLHRCNEGTLSRMRTEYVIPLQGKIGARIDHLEADSKAATSTSHRKKLERERDKLVKQQAELQTFDEKLRHYADKRISLDLDDGVKVNYGKFGDLLAEVKAVTGENPK